MENYQQAVQILQDIEEFEDIRNFNIAFAYFKWGKYNKAQ